MTSDLAFSAFVFVMAIVTGLLGLVGVINPELSFRLQNLFQVGRVELTQFGRVMHYYGGLLAIVVGFLLTVPLALQFTVLYTVLYLLIVGTAAYIYRDTLRPSPLAE